MAKVEVGFSFIGRPDKGITDLQTGKQLSREQAVEKMVAEMEARRAARKQEQATTATR